jgi:predicted nucleotidyltransferase
MIMRHGKLIESIIDNIKTVDGLQAIVLGGSWASGRQHTDSDIDLGLYYNAGYPLDIHQVRNIANELNDLPSPVVTDLGGWGRWVNGGAWLTIQGQRVDYLYRDIDFVSSVIDACNKGEIQSDYWQQPAYGFHSYMYCAETNICKIFYDPGGIIVALKTKVVQYPLPLKEKIIKNFTWSAQFTLEVAKKSARQGDVYFVAGSLTRAVSCLVQVLYALNETYFISDKRMYRDVEQFAVKPQNFAERMNRILGAPGRVREELEESLKATEALLSDTIALFRRV